MSPITWEEFKRILNKIDKEHKVKLIPTTQKGRYTNEEKGKSIRFVQPVISMSNNDISIITFTDINGESYRFHTNSGSKSKTLCEHVINWLEN